MMRFITGRGFLTLAFAILMVFVIVTDPDFFNPNQVLTLAPHHEQLFVVLIVLASVAVAGPAGAHRALLFLVALVATLLSIATILIPP